MLTHPYRSQSEKKFLLTLASTMHHMAQPLSSIQASLELASLSPTTAEQYKRIGEDVLMHLRRAVESMQFTARLVRFQQPAADVGDVMLSTALQEVISDLQPVLDMAQLQLLVVGSKNEQSIRISATRLRQMLFYLFQAVQACGQTGDCAKIEILAPAGRMVLRIQHAPDRRSDKRSPDKYHQPDSIEASNDSAVNRALALSEAIVSGAGGEFSVSINPLLIVADFPVKRESESAVRVIGKNKHSDFASLQLAAISPRLSKMS